MSKLVDESIKDNKYVAVAKIGKTEVMAYRGNDKNSFYTTVANNAYVNLMCFIDGKPVHKERVLLGDD